MSNVRRVYVEKKPDFAVKAKELKHEIKHYLGITTVEAVRVLIRYDVENISEETYKKALYTVFSEPPVDDIYEETFDYGDAKVFTVEFLPGQFDQRADSAEQCVKLLNENEEPIIRSAITYVIEGNITDEQFEAIKKHCINPVDSRAIGMEKPETLVQTALDRWHGGSEAAFRNQLVEQAKKYLGTEYRWGGKSGRGIDCSGLVSSAYMQCGVLIYRDAKLVEGWPMHEISFEEKKRGDALYFPGHIALYLGEGRYIHSTGAANSGGVVLNSLDPADPLYREDLVKSLYAVGSLF